MFYNCGCLLDLSCGTALNKYYSFSKEMFDMLDYLIDLIPVNLSHTLKRKYI